jgi:hypothetical protein
MVIGDDEPGVVLIARIRLADFRLRKHSMLAECMRQMLHSEEGKLMTRASRIPLHRKFALTVLAVAVVASSFSVDAQYRRPPGYGRPPPHGYYGPRRGGGGGGGALIAGALLGVVAGAAIANSNAAAAAPPPGVVYSAPPPPPPPGVVYYDNGAPPPPPGY